MERLTERDEFGNANIIEVDSAEFQLSLDFDDFNRVANALNKLTDYEDLEEQGKLLKLPVAVGDTYFCIDDGSYPNEWEFVNVQQIISVMDKIGKTVFLTRQEAERALEEMEGKK